MKKMFIFKFIIILFFFIIIMLCGPSTFAAEVLGITDGMIYNIENKASGKNLNVNLAQDANGTNVIQWSDDGSIEQKFRVVYYSNYDSYKIYAMCSDKRF